MKNILVLGGTGKTGRRIARHLQATGHLVRTASRTSGDIPFDLEVAAGVRRPVLQTAAGHWN